MGEGALWGWERAGAPLILVEPPPPYFWPRFFFVCFLLVFTKMFIVCFVLEIKFSVLKNGAPPLKNIFLYTPLDCRPSPERHSISTPFATSLESYCFFPA